MEEIIFLIAKISWNGGPNVRRKCWTLFANVIERVFPRSHPQGSRMEIQKCRVRVVPKQNMQVRKKRWYDWATEKKRIHFALMFWGFLLSLFWNCMYNFCIFLCACVPVMMVQARFVIVPAPQLDVHMTINTTWLDLGSEVAARIHV